MLPANRQTKTAKNLVKAAIVLYGLQLVLSLILHVQSYRRYEVDGISITLQMETPWYGSMIPGIGLVLDAGDFMLGHDTAVTFQYGDWTYTQFSDDVDSVDWKDGLQTRKNGDWISLYAKDRDMPIISMPIQGAWIDP